MEESIRKGHNMVGLVFGSNYTECMFYRLEDGLLAENDTLSCASIVIYPDNTLTIPMWSFVTMFLNQFNTTIVDFVDQMDQDIGLLNYPLKFYTINQQELKMEFTVYRYALSGWVSFIHLSFN